jgi:predicted DNA-binding WGR domain protein
MQLAQDYIADLRRCETVTRCYGNQRKALRAARAKLVAAMVARGYTEAEANQTAKGCHDVYELERLGDDE